MSVWSRAWPMCRVPVTFGGGSTIEYGGLPEVASAAKYPAFTQPSYRSASTSPGFQLLGRASARLRELSGRSEEHTSELKSLMRISYAVFCLKKKIKKNTI